MADLHFLPASELTRMVAAREISSRELLDHFLARIDHHNPTLNAVVALDLERARTRAAAADEASARGETWGALHGLPMTVKDAIETEGLVTTCGAPMLAGHIPSRDADAVTSLRAAGAVVFGKTNTPMYAGDFQTYNDLYGVTNNPWDTARGVGGSSGGSAAAVAVGLTGLDIGSDIGGSVRNPAHFCGVFGLKPTWGTVPMRGHIPGPPGSLATVDVASLGPLGRSAADLDLALDVIAGPEPRAAVAWQLRFPPPRRDQLRDYRLAAWLDDPQLPVDGAVRDRLAATVTALRDAGVVVDEVEPPVSATEGMRLWERLVWPIMASGLPPDAWEAACAGEAAPVVAEPEPVRQRWARATALRHRDWIGVHEERLRAGAAWADFFTRYDVLLAPVMQVAAFPHDTERGGDDRSLTVDGTPVRYWDGLYWCSMFGAVLLPAASAPTGLTPEGLPVGVQIVGPYLEDRTVIDVARAVGQVLGGFRPPPGY